MISIERKIHYNNTNTVVMDRNQFALVTVAKEALSTVPVSVGVTLRRPLCKCWPSLTRSYRVASFVFEEEQHSSDTSFTSLTSKIDTFLLVRYKQHLSAHVKMTVVGRGGEKLKARFDLDAFLEDLTTTGFVQMGSELILRLVTSDCEKLQVEREDFLHDEDLQEQDEKKSESCDLDNNGVSSSLETQEQDEKKKKRKRRRMKKKSQKNRRDCLQDEEKSESRDLENNGVFSSLETQEQDEKKRKRNRRRIKKKSQKEGQNFLQDEKKSESRDLENNRVLASLETQEQDEKKKKRTRRRIKKKSRKDEAK